MPTIAFNPNDPSSVPSDALSKATGYQEINRVLQLEIDPSLEQIQNPSPVDPAHVSARDSVTGAHDIERALQDSNDPSLSQNQSGPPPESSTGLVVIEVA